VTAVVASLFADRSPRSSSARTIRRPAGAGTAHPRHDRGIKIALWRLHHLAAVPFLLFAGVGVVLFFSPRRVQGLQYFELAAMRFHSVAEAKAAAASPDHGFRRPVHRGLRIDTDSTSPRRCSAPRAGPHPQRLAGPKRE
jgi:hypothetical protein